MAYWDTACLLKLYVPEHDSATYRARVIAQPVVLTSSITRLELFTALCRKASAGDIGVAAVRQATDTFDSDVSAGRIGLKQVDLGTARQFETAVALAYRQRPVVPLRTLDAIHLATALVAGQSEMVTTDRRLRDASAAHGLALFPP